MHRTALKFASFVFLLLGAMRPALAGDELAVDFGYRPPQWRTAICPPDSPYKTLVNEKGALLYHFGSPPGSFGTSLRATVDPRENIAEQKLVSPKIPIVQTRLETEHLSILEETFAVNDPEREPPKTKPAAIRKSETVAARNWAKPQDGVSPRLSTVVVGWNKPIRCRIEVPPGASRTVALALCEGYHDRPGRRVMELSAEGAPPQKVDPVADLGKNVAGAFWFAARDANGDGLIDVKVSADASAQDKNTILNALWVFDAPVKRDDAALLTGKLDSQAALASYNGDTQSRNDILLVRVTNKSDVPQTVAPKFIVSSVLKLENFGGDRVRIDGLETVLCTAEIASLAIQKAGDREEAVMALKPATIAPGGTFSFAAVYCGGGRIECPQRTLEDALREREAAERFWKTVDLPYGHIAVPDENIQALIDSSIRNIWQAREIKNGLPSFQVGATCYRSLWVVDGAFIFEAAALVGAADQARAGIAYELSFQKEDGGFGILSSNYHKENGIVLWTCARHARLSQDKEWLRSIWPKLEKVVAYIKQLRRRSREDDSPLNDGLMPKGVIDGGIGGTRHEYTNVYWNLTGLKAIIDAARWLGKNEQADEWQKEYDDFYAAFRDCAKRDLKTDAHGNPYLAILIPPKNPPPDAKKTDDDIPCKAQWAFCHGVYPGQLFAKDDPLVAGNLAMLGAFEKEGMVATTGWITKGIWNYFASFYGHALLWQGQGQKAAEVLYAFANHAAPLLVWIEEQGFKNEPILECGDCPHNWASAEFIRLAVHLLALDRGKQMHLFEGLPKPWTAPGMVTKLDKISTPFGPLTFSLAIAEDGATATLNVEPLSDPSCEKIVVHLAGWASSNPKATLELDPQKSQKITIPIEFTK
ncbi:MAG: hypothetical protein IT426_00320 [Pirellulales bacterium]|nr:hypothetical protein [Pirellulales bacterium]